MPKKLFIYFSVALACLSCANIFAQHNSVVSQYMFNMFAINPAYAGAKEYAAINALYRNQWVGFDGAPVSQSISYHMPIDRSKLGVGIQIYNDRIGVTKEFGIMASGAYRLQLEKAKLCFGLSGGFKNFTSEWTKLTVHEQGDHHFSYDTQNKFRPEFGLGIYYQANNYFAGFAIPYIFNAQISENNESINTYYDARNTNYIFNAGMAFQLNDMMVLKPSVLFKVNPASTSQFDFNANLILSNRFWFGLSYRDKDAFLGLFEVQVNERIKFGYSYDFTLSDIRLYSSGSHELSFEYVVGRKPTIISPRFAPKLYF